MRTWTENVIPLPLECCFPPLQEFEREKHAHSILQFQFAEVKEALKQREELLEVSHFSKFSFAFYLFAHLLGTWEQSVGSLLK